MAHVVVLTLAHYTAIAQDPTKAFVLVRIRYTSQFLVPAEASLPSRNRDTAQAQAFVHAKDRGHIKAKSMAHLLALTLA